MQLRPNQSNDCNSSDASLLIHSTYLTVQSSSKMPPHKASSHIYQWDGSSSVFEQTHCVAASLTFHYRQPARAASVISTWWSGLKAFFIANFILGKQEIMWCLWFNTRQMNLKFVSEAWEDAAETHKCLSVDCSWDLCSMLYTLTCLKKLSSINLLSWFLISMRIMRISKTNHKT